MYTPKRKQQKKRRKTQKQHCFIDEALSINYPFPNKIFTPLSKGMRSLPTGTEIWAQIPEGEIDLLITSIKKGGFKGGATNFEIGMASWLNYIVGLKDIVVEKIIETYKNTLPIPVIGEIVKIVSEYFTLVSIPVTWMIGLIANAFTSIVGTVKSNWHYVLVLITSLDLIEWAGTAVNAAGQPYFAPAQAVSTLLNNTILNFGAVMHVIWSIVATIWTIVVYWIPSNVLMFIFSNSLFSFSIVIYMFVVLMMWLSEHLNPSYYIRMMDAKQEMNNINQKLIDMKKLKDVPSKNIMPIELNEKIRKVEEDLRRAKEAYREKKRAYEEDLQRTHPEEYVEYNLNRLKEAMEKTHKEHKESESAVKKVAKSKVRAERDKAARQAEKTGQKYQAAKAAYDAANAAAAAASPVGSSSSSSGGSHKQNEKDIDYESIIHRLLSKKSLANFKNLSTAEIEEIRKKQPFPFEIALALGFIKKTDDGYELVERRIQKLKEPIIESISFLNHRSNKKGGKKGGDLDTPLENHELDSLREALTGIKMLHTASIYAVTREAVEMEGKHKMSGGGKSDSEGDSESEGESREPEPFLNISQTLNQLKPADMNWLQEKFPDDFKIAEKLGIVNKGELSHSATDMLKDTAEMSKNIIKKKIPKTSQKVLFPTTV